MKMKLTGFYGDKERTVTVNKVEKIDGQSAYKGIWPNGRWVRISTNRAVSYHGTKVRTVLKDFTEKIIIPE